MTGKKDTVLPKIVVPRVKNVRKGLGDTDNCVAVIELIVLTSDPKLARRSVEELLGRIRCGRVGIAPEVAVPAETERRERSTGWGGGGKKKHA